MRTDLGIPSIIVSGGLHEVTEADIAPIAPRGKSFSPMKMHSAIRDADDGRGRPWRFPHLPHSPLEH
ncbi:hypothetical protein [Limimaricola soesokkakensis]|uniref:hypothetical protein n=1 Tax=Limimaricola soesokkakensis TaxID=1343159 RepID=UPI003518FC22